MNSKRQYNYSHQTSTSHINPHNKKGKEFYGEALWKVIHSFAASYTIEKKDAFKTFMFLLCELMTCEMCKCHLRERLQTLDIDNYLSNAHDCFFFTYLLHDFVNQEYNKKHSSDENFIKKISPPFEQLKVVYFKAVSENCKECERV